MSRAVDRSKVTWEAYPGAANDLEAMVPFGWACEAHPDQPVDHDGCGAPGVPARCVGCVEGCDQDAIVECGRETRDNDTDRYGR